MDERLNVKKTISVASHKLFLLWKVRPLLTDYAALQIYKAMILPVIEYGNVFYAAAKKTSAHEATNHPKRVSESSQPNAH